VWVPVRTRINVDSVMSNENFFLDLVLQIMVMVWVTVMDL